MEISIEISYKYRTGEVNNVIGKQYALLPEQYFDLNSLDENESVNIDTLPSYNHALEYFCRLEPNFDRKKLSETKIILRQGLKTKIVSEKFWNEGNNCLIECLDLYPDDYSNVLIVATLVDGKFQEETLRIIKEIGMDTFEIVSHSIVDVRTDEYVYSYSTKKF